MRIERLLKLVILVVLTTVVVFQISFSLVQSWSQPQIQSRLELYQTNLLLHATEWRSQTPAESEDLTPAREVLMGGDPIKNAKQQYEKALEGAEKTQSKLVAMLQELSSQDRATSTQANRAKPELQVSPLEDAPSTLAQRQQLQESLSQIAQLINELNLRLGILQVQQGQIVPAIQTWQTLNSAIGPTQSTPTPLIQTAEVLVGLWSDPPRLLPEAETQIQKNLDSWFRYRALSQLYQLQQRQDRLLELETQEQLIAKDAMVKLALIAGIPGVGGILGIMVLLIVVGQRLWQGKRSLLATNEDTAWEVPWDGEIIWQVLLAFFLIGQLLLPYFLHRLLLGLNINPVNFTVRMNAFYVLVSYGLLASGGLVVLYLSIKPFLPLAEGWFRVQWRSNWIFWGLGGYLVAVPLVISVSLINQQLWQGQGGSNPILPLVLEGRDNVALIIFFVTACLAAPFFEEMIFRAFLLPSLTRYFPVWGAILTSSLIFAIAHLSLSEVLPLTTLGIVLGVVYTRSRNLLAPMFVHSLWNSGTLISLFILGSGGN